MSEPLRRLIPQARALITKESFRDQSFGDLNGYTQDLPRPIDTAPLLRVVQTAMQMFPPRDEGSDRWLAPRVHASLRLFRSEAADQGIWDYLSVVVLRDYVLWRVAGKDGTINDLNEIIGPFRHQAVARLWWAAELSRNGADYRPTQEAFSSPDAVNYLTNVDAFHNRPAALAYIRFIAHKSGEKPIKQRAIETGRTLNHVLTTVVLDSFAPDSGSDMNAQEQWIYETPDGALMDSVLPIGPSEPQVPEEKIYAVEQLLEGLMRERRWNDVVDWSEQWIAQAQANEPTEVGPSPDGNGPKEGLGIKVATETVSYEHFGEALRKDLGVEPSEETRALFEKLSQNKPLEAMAAPGLTVSTNAGPVRGDETSGSNKAALAGPAGSGDTPLGIVETAENVYAGLSPEQQTLARSILLQLTELGEGTRDTARSVNTEELILRPENALPVNAMLKILSDAHLIVSDEAAIRMADERLIREWKRMREWLDEDRAGLHLHRQLTQAAKEWEMMRRDPNLLYRGARLAQALEWAQANEDKVSVSEREFLAASKNASEHAEQSAAAAETRRAAEEHRAAVQWRRRAFIFAMAMVILPIIVAIVVYLAR